VVECLPSKTDAPSSNPRIPKKEKKLRGDRENRELTMVLLFYPDYG
jgi:hypothetical protein